MGWQPDWGLIWPIVASMAVGGLIGVERTYHGHPAGFRTHTLVCLTACVLMLAAMRQAQWDFVLHAGQSVVTDPTRMAHGVLTGLGFLCAGVIFREGFSVHGLTTAASLWTTSAIGMLFGAGMGELGVVAAGASLLVLGILRLVDAQLPHLGVMDLSLRWRRDAAPSEAAVRTLLAELGMKATRIGHVLRRDGALYEHHIKVKGPMPLRIDALVERLNQEAELTGFSVLPRDD